MSTQAPINAVLVLDKAKQESELLLAGMTKIEAGMDLAQINGVEEWNTFSWWKKYWSWCDSAEQWGRSRRDDYERLWSREHGQRKRSYHTAQGLIQLASTTSEKVMLSSEHAKFLNISDER